MKTKQKAQEILDYCVSYLTPFDNKEIEKFEKTKRYKEMLKEIEFMINTG